jgi:hypothetical protein
MKCPKCKGKATVTHTETSDEKMETVKIVTISSSLLKGRKVVGSTRIDIKS